MVEQVLVEAGLTLSGVDCIAYSAGPGSFTGLRIGFGVVQGLAFGADIPVIGVSSLEAMACRAQRQALVDEGRILTAFDARMGEVYWACYQLAQGKLELEYPASAMTPAAVAELLADSSIRLAVGNGWPLLEEQGLKADACDGQLTPDALGVLAVAGPLAAQGRYVAVEEAGLVYIRDEVSWQKRRKIRG